MLVQGSAFESIAQAQIPAALSISLRRIST
jgi:hypothetical protein